MATKKATKPIEHPIIIPQPISDVESVKCECCGLTEDCTPPYIHRVRDRHDGRWICGLCSEAVKDETLRSNTKISTAEAVKRHIKFHTSFRSSISSPLDPAEDHLISAMKLLLRRSIESPKKDAGDSRSAVLIAVSPPCLGGGVDLIRR